MPHHILLLHVHVVIENLFVKQHLHQMFFFGFVEELIPLARLELNQKFLVMTVRVATILIVEVDKAIHTTLQTQCLAEKRRLNVDNHLALMHIRLLCQFLHHLLDVGKLAFRLIKKGGLNFLTGTYVYRPVGKDLMHRSEIVSIGKVENVVKKLVSKVTK